ncbi:hypothetical protein ACSTLF_00300, partial [Vibrio parahaemolyticus]
ELVRQFAGSRSFRLIPAPPDDAAAARLMVAGKAQMVLDIPAGFGRDLATGRHPGVGMAVDGSSPFTAAN